MELQNLRHLRCSNRAYAVVGKDIPLDPCSDAEFYTTKVRSHRASVIYSRLSHWCQMSILLFRKRKCNIEKR